MLINHWRYISRAACALVLAVAAGSLAGQERRISRPVALKSLVTKVEPTYPVVARQMKMEGTVEVDACVGESGTVETVKTINGNPVLGKAAEDAVKKWKFTPFKTDDGKPLKAIVNLAFTFKM
jgi:protein TonB